MLLTWKQRYLNLEKELEKKNYDKVITNADLLLNNIPWFFQEYSEQIKKLKAIALNNKALSLSGDKIEECLNLLNQAVGIFPNDIDIKENRFTKFKVLFFQKLGNKNYQEIPIIFNKAMKYNDLSTKMKDYLYINKPISNYFNCLYRNKKKLNQYKNMRKVFFIFWIILEKEKRKMILIVNVFYY